LAQPRHLPALLIDGEQQPSPRGPLELAIELEHLFRRADVAGEVNDTSDTAREQAAQIFRHGFAVKAHGKQACGLLLEFARHLDSVFKVARGPVPLLDGSSRTMA
jgi:hypothetical protein